MKTFKLVSLQILDGWIVHHNTFLEEEPLLENGEENLQITVNEYFIRKNELILLATDGFYEARKSVYSKTIAELNSQENLKENFDKIVQDFEMMTNDDLTAVILKRKE